MSVCLQKDTRTHAVHYVIQNNVLLLGFIRQSLKKKNCLFLWAYSCINRHIYTIFIIIIYCARILAIMPYDGDSYTCAEEGKGQYLRQEGKINEL